jgi:hypothetical protein
LNITPPAPEEKDAARGGLRRVAQECGKELVIMCGIALVTLLFVLLASAKLANDDCNVPCSMHALISGPFGALAFALASLKRNTYL